MSDPAGPDLPRALAWAEGTLGPIAGSRPLTGGRTSTMLRLEPEQGPPAVLRLMDREPWRTHGPALTTREHEVQGLLAGTALRAPRSLALDADGAAAGVPAHLMTLLPGRSAPVLGRERVEALVDVMVALHGTEPSIPVRPWQSWAGEAKWHVPAWAQDAAVWHDAFDVLRGDPPAAPTTLIHRDLQPSNVLWEGEAISGVVDWVETSTGPAWLDVAHCATWIAVEHGVEAGEELARAYRRRTGAEPLAWFDVMDLVAHLPLPGRQDWFGDDGPERMRLEERLRRVLATV